MGTVLQLSTVRKEYPRDRDTSRPFRLWDAKEKQHLRWRCYKVRDNAHNGALIDVSWAKIGTSIEVYDSRNGRMIGQYTMTATGLKIWRA